MRAGPTHHPRGPLCTILLQFLFALFFAMMHLAIASREKPYSREWGHYPLTKGHLEKEQPRQFKLPESRPISKKVSCLSGNVKQNVIIRAKSGHPPPAKKAAWDHKLIP